jgi:DNA-binding NtrC family response regulator
MREVSSILIRKTLEVTNNNKRKAAEILGISRTTLLTKIRDLNIEQEH